MTNSSTSTTRDCFITAARKLVTNIAPVRGDGGGSRVLFAGGERLTSRTSQALCIAATNADLDIVYLQFAASGAAEELRKVFIILPRDGVCRVYTDCAFWMDDMGSRFAIVPRNLKTGYFMMDGLDLGFDPHRLVPDRQVGMKRASVCLRERALEESVNTASSSFVELVLPPGS